MVDKAADRAALLLWRALQCLSVLLLSLILAVLVARILFPTAPIVGGPAGALDVEPAPASVLAGPPVSGAGLSVVLSPATFTPIATSVPTSPLVAPTQTPLAPALPHAGQLTTRADAEALLALASQARWQRAPSNTVPTATPTDPLPPPPAPTAQPLPSPTAVNRPPTRIVAPSIGLDATIVPVKWKKVIEGGREVLTWIVPKNKVAWHFTSAPPGEPGNTVLTGHRNIYAEVFRYIVDLKPGDPITLYAGNRAFVYYVEEQHIVQEVGVPASVRAENARWIARTDDVRLTLVTCAPYEAPGNTHRVIVVARPAE